MRKAISIALSLCILLASFSGAILGTAIADNTTNANSVFYDDSNWEIHKRDAGDGTITQILGGAAVNDGYETATTVNNYQGKNVAIQLYGVAADLPAIKFGVEKGLLYSLSFKYFIPEGTTSPNNYLVGAGNYVTNIGVYSAGATFSNGNYSSGGAVLGTGTPAKATVTGQWTDVEIQFNSAQNTEVYFAAFCAIGSNESMYLADFELTQKANYFENAANWTIYNNNGTLGGSKGDNGDWMSITNEYGFEGKDVVVKGYARDKVSALAFAVEANKLYTLKFKYFVDSTATMTSLKGVGVYTAGATFNGSGEYASGGAVLGTAAPEVVSGQWKEVTVEFDSANNTTAYLAAYWLISDQTIYFADFELTKTEVNEYENAANWTIYNNNGTLGGSKGDDGDWMSITNEYGFEGKDVVVKGYARDKVSALAFAVEANKLYTLKFKYFVDSAATMTSLKGVGVYTAGATFNGSGEYASGGAVLGTAAPEVVSGQWKEVTVEFGSANNTTVYLAAYWLISDQTIYFADFELTERALPELNAYNNAANWTIYNNNGTLGGSKGDNGDWMSITNEYGFEGKDVVVKGYARDKVSALAFAVETGKHYKLTFKYFVDSAATMTSLKGVGVYTEGATFNGSGEYASGGAVLGTAAPEVVSGQWKEVTVEFDSANNTTAYLAAYWLISDQTIYFADFELNEYAAPSYYEDGSNWEVYGNAGTLDGSQKGKVYGTWMKGSTVYNFQGKNVAVLASVRDAMATLPITVEANKYYTLTFKYFVTDDSAYHDNMIDAETGNKYFMKSLGVYAPNSTFSSGGYTWNVGAPLGTVDNEGAQGEWKEVKINFGSAENTKVYFAAFCLINETNAVYFADFELIELPNWALYQDYENHPKTIGTEAAPYGSWQSITESDVIAEGAKDDTSIKIRANYDAVAYKLDTVKTKSRYALTFKYFIPAEGNTKEADFLPLAGVYAEGATVTAGQALNTTEVSTKGAWAEATVTFDTKENTSVYFAALVKAFDGDITTAAETYVVYIDDIELAEVAGLQTAYNNKASIRAAKTTDGTVDKNGLRAYNQVLMDYIEGKEIVEYGSIVIRQGYLEGKFGIRKDPEFTTKTIDNTDRNLIDLYGKGVGIGVAYRTEDATNTITKSAVAFEGAIDMLWESTSSEKVFTSYITGISEANYGEEYLVRTYAIDADGNIYYGETSSISIFKVAKAMDDKYTEDGSLGETEAQDIDAFKEFIGATKEQYVEWCGGAGVGHLYNELFSNVQ